MKKVNKIIVNAVNILDYLIDNNAMHGNGAKVRDIFESLDLSNEDFDVADTYLLQHKYVDGTLGGMDGSRYLQSSGVDFYENNSTLLNDTPVQQGNGSMTNAKKVFVVHGRDGRLRDDFFAFLRALGLDPIEWPEALKLTGKGTPYIGEVLDSAFKNAQAVIVLLSPDDEVRLSPELWKDPEEENEREYKLQARPNVLFEAGRAFGTHPDRTLLIEVGQVKAFSDVAGRHVVRLSNSAEKRNEVAERLRNSGCDVNTGGSDWLKTGNFDINRGKKKPTPRFDIDITEIIKNIKETVKNNYIIHQRELLSPNIRKASDEEGSRGFDFPTGALAGRLFDIHLKEISIFASIIREATLSFTHDSNASLSCPELSDLFCELLITHNTSIKNYHNSLIIDLFSYNDSHHTEEMVDHFNKQADIETKLRCKELLSSLKIKDLSICSAMKIPNWIPIKKKSPEAHQFHKEHPTNI